MTPEQEERLFTVMGRVEARLDSGDKAIEESKKTTKRVNLHLERHRMGNRAIGVLGAVILAFLSAIFSGWFG